MSKLTKTELAAIEARMRALPDPDLTNPDNPEWTAEDFARATAVEDLPAAERKMIYAAFPKTQRRGRGPSKKPRKLLVSLRLDQEIVEAYRATGDGWQGRINADLAAASKRHARVTKD